MYPICSIIGLTSEVISVHNLVNEYETWSTYQILRFWTFLRHKSVGSLISSLQKLSLFNDYPKFQQKSERMINENSLILLLKVLLFMKGKICLSLMVVLKLFFTILKIIVEKLNQWKTPKFLQFSVYSDMKCEDLDCVLKHNCFVSLFATIVNSKDLWIEIPSNTWWKNGFILKW